MTYALAPCKEQLRIRRRFTWGRIPSCQRPISYVFGGLAQQVQGQLHFLRANPQRGHEAQYVWPGGIDEEPKLARAVNE